MSEEEEAIAQHLRELEESLLMVSVRKSERVDQLLAEGFVEFGSSGRVFSKEEIIASLRDEPPVKVTATAFKVVLFAPNTALLTYRAHRHSTPPVYTLRSSYWLVQHGRWRMVFHQGTLASAWQ